MGKDCVQIYLNLNISGKDRNDAQACLTALENYFKTQCNVFYEHCVFNSYVSTIQGSQLTATSRAYGNLHLPSSCEFGSLTEELIRDRSVIGLIDRGTKGELLREKSPTLDKAIDIASF